MQTLEAGLNLEVFLKTIPTAQQRVLLLDYDGTLAPFRVERDQAVPYDGVRELLTSILAVQRTRLVVISGRAVQDLIPLLGEPLPEIWGSHGWERLLPDGTYSAPEFDTDAAEGLAHARAWVRQSNLGKDRVEDKPASVAIHWRGLDPQEVEAVRAVALQGWSPLAHASGLTLKSFDGGIELGVPGKDKGVAVRTILAEVGANSVAAYLGDDRTDEDAFEAIKGRGLGILVRPELRATAASVWLKPPEEMLEFLKHWR